MYRVFSVFCVAFVLISCSEKKPTKQKSIVKFIKSPAAINSAQPFLFSGDKTLLSWIENEQDSLYTLKYSELINEQWDAAKTITSGSDWFVNWADFPAIAEQNGHILTHFLQMSAEGTYTYDIKMKLGSGSDNTWKNDFILHNDGTKSEHGFVTTLPYKNDSFFVTWLDGRNTSGGHDHSGAGAMTLRSAEIQLTGEIIDETELDHKTCDCCQTSAAITSNGPIVIYRDRSDEEIRDIYIVRKTDSVWTRPKAVFNDDWKIAGCPVNGPKAVAIDNSLAVVWYTGANEIPKVKLIFSKDGGEKFNEPILIDEIQTVGRVDVAMLDKEHVLVSWVTSEESTTVIKALKVSNLGKKGKELVVAAFDPSRSSGFPQLEVVNDDALFAWVDVTGEKTNIKTVTIPLTDF